MGACYSGDHEEHGCCDQAVHDFLDSRYGRHFADEVAMGLCSGRDLWRAIDKAIERWMDMQEALLEGAA